MKEIAGAYEPKAVEDKIYRQWLESGFFTPEKLPGKRTKKFVVMIAPPNITGSLHMGHALENTILWSEDRAKLVPTSYHAVSIRSVAKRRDWGFLRELARIRNMLCFSCYIIKKSIDFLNMANFNNSQGGNNRFGNGGGRPKYGDNHSGRPSFTKKSWGDNRSSDRPTMLYKATCAECGKPCEVPFRPVSGRPIYCKECFDKKGGNTGGGGDRGGNRFFKSTRDNTRDNDVISKQLEAVNIKLERLIQAVEALALNNSIGVKREVKDTLVSVSKKISKKIAVKNKK